MFLLFIYVICTTGSLVNIIIQDEKVGWVCSFLGWLSCIIWQLNNLAIIWDMMYIVLSNQKGLSSYDSTDNKNRLFESLSFTCERAWLVRQLR